MLNKVKIMMWNIEQELIEIEESGLGTDIKIIDRLLVLKDFYKKIEVLDYQITHHPDNRSSNCDSVLGMTFEEIMNHIDNPDKVVLKFEKRIEFMELLRIISNELDKYPEEWFDVECTLLKEANGIWLRQTVL
jgi:hypothetical protein